MIYIVILLIILNLFWSWRIYQQHVKSTSELKAASQIKLTRTNQQQKINHQIQILSDKKSDIQKDIDDLQKIIQQRKNNIDSELKVYQDNIDLKKKQKQEQINLALKELEQQFYNQKIKVSTELDHVNLELDKMKATRAAAKEAFLRQEEIKRSQDEYCLIPTPADLQDIAKLQRIKLSLNKPRILSMLIWQTYWQPLAKKQFPQILGSTQKTGIYKITNLLTNECYIGQAVD